MSSRDSEPGAATFSPVRRVVAFACSSVLAVACAAVGDAAIVAPGADDAILALTPRGAPRVAYVSGSALFLASPRAGGRWRSVRIAALPSGRPRVAGLEVTDGGRAFVLVEDEEGRWLVLADRPRTRWRLRVVARELPAEAVLGPAGLTLDRVGKPAVAYAFRLPDRRTFLRLVTGGSFRTIAITLEGFPESGVVPAAAPVRMPDGTIRVLETYAARGGGAILWRYATGEWRGLFLSSSVGGTAPVGPVFAEAAGPAFAAAWTLAGPAAGEFQARLARRPDRPQAEILHRRARVEAVLLTAGDVLVAASESVAGLTAGLLLAADSTELDGRILGAAASAGGVRHLLLANPDGLSWYSTPVLQALEVSLRGAAGPEGTVQLSGRVGGRISGRVEIYRERSGVARELVGTAPIAADGSFAAVDVPPTRPVLYRAVYRDELSGIPYASLLRTPVS